MSKSQHNTLCIAEWQSFGVEDIYRALKPCHLKQDEVSKNSSANVQNPLDSSVASLPQNDKNIESRDDDELLDKTQKIFKELKDFADEKGNHIFLNSYGKNRLKARNFVGLIQTKSGFCLEILPKSFRTDNENQGFEKHQNKIQESKDILLNMLRTLRSSPFKQSHISNLKIHRPPLLEVFAIMFLDEVERLIKRGIKSDYVVREENRTFLKGKLLFGENLKRNFAHKERFFTASDEFIADIAPNRLLVSTILFLSAQGFSPRTSGRISQARFIFADISPSKSIDKDFAMCPSSRHYKDYELLLAWCEIFLRRKSFMPYQGGDKAFALLFDMNKLFENFVAWHLKRACGNERVIKAQESHKYLLQIGGVSKFQIKPDIVCRKSDSGGNNVVFIADTKWKILESSESNNYGISQSDLYQMFAYLAKYQCTKGYLIYPKIADNESIKHRSFTYKAQICFYDDKPKENPPPHKKQEMKLKIYFFNLRNPSEAANEILAQINAKTYDL